MMLGGAYLHGDDPALYRHRSKVNFAVLSLPLINF